MRFNFFLKSSCLFILFFFAGPVFFLNADSQVSQNIRHDFPSLIKSIQFKNDIFYCGIRIPVNHQDVKQRLEKEMLLALWDRPQVILWIKRAAKFFPHVEKILKQQGLPLDLKYVPIIESALKPHATSSKGAVGYWQFIKSTGKHYGLKIDGTIDERKNIFKSTRAACRYFKTLTEKFGSYFLALAAFNMGEYALNAEIKSQDTHDFFSLYLPLQTQRYAFKIICAKLILENPELYGFYLKKSDLYPMFTFDQINIFSDVKIPITLVARAADIPFKMIKDYNPELRGYYIDKGRVSLLIPRGRAKGFKVHFKAYYKEWEKTVKTRFHIVKRGESLTAIAKKYRMTLSLLLKLNSLSLKGVIHPGDRLVIQ